MSAHAWREAANCLGLDTELWIPAGQGGKIEPLVWSTCRSCPVIQQCVDFAIVNQIREGVWGGTRLSERRRMKPGDKPKILARCCKECGGPAPIPSSTYCGACADERIAARDGASRRANQKSVA